MLALVLVPKVTHDYQLMGLERTIFVSMTDRMLVGNNRDRSNTVLNNPMNNNNCEKENPKRLPILSGRVRGCTANPVDCRHVAAGVQRDD
jgi:hypothetical protein